jgi:sortase A
MMRPRAAARRRRRILRRLSTALILAGVLVLADAVVTVVWLEPVTALRAKLTQDGLERDLDELERLGPTDADLRALQRAGLLAEGRAGHHRRAREARAAQRRVPLLARRLARRVDDGQAIGRLRVPRLDLDLVVVKGSSPAPLRKGPGTFDDTPLPGAHGTAAIAGHRTTYGAPFRDIDALRRGDAVRVTMPYATIRYRVEGHRIVDPEDLGVLRRVAHDRLILSACHPRFSARQRIVVFARVERVVPARLGRSASALKRVASTAR